MAVAVAPATPMRAEPADCPAALDEAPAPACEPAPATGAETAFRPRTGGRCPASASAAGRAPRGTRPHPAWSVPSPSPARAALTVGDASRGAGEVGPWQQGQWRPRPRTGSGRLLPAGSPVPERSSLPGHDRGRGRRDDRSLGGRRRGRRHSTGREERGRVDVAVGCRETRGSRGGRRGSATRPPRSGRRPRPHHPRRRSRPWRPSSRRGG